MGVSRQTLVQIHQFKILFRSACRGNARVDGSKFKRLNNEDFLLQLCLHNAAHAYVRPPGIRLYLDIDWYLQNFDVNWERFLGKVVHWRVKAKAYWSLAITKELFQSDIPERILESLEPYQWNQIIVKKILQNRGFERLGGRDMHRLELFLLTILLYDNPMDFFRELNLFQSN